MAMLADEGVTDTESTTISRFAVRGCGGGTTGAGIASSGVVAGAGRWNATSAVVARKTEASAVTTSHGCPRHTRSAKPGSSGSSISDDTVGIVPDECAPGGSAALARTPESDTPGRLRSADGVCVSGGAWPPCCAKMAAPPCCTTDGGA